MTLTKEMQKKVEENMGLVGKVISDKIHSLDTPNFYSYDDLFQIGCIGLCKAAYSDCGGTFSTYAYRCIKNEILYFLRREKRHKDNDVSLSKPISTDKNGNVMTVDSTISTDDVG